MASEHVDLRGMRLWLIRITGVAVGLLVATAGCGRDDARSPPDAEARSEDGAAAANCGTYERHNCGPGRYCNGSSACGSDWNCQSEPPLGCSAGLIGLFCGCDGVVVSSTGCPMRYAYPLGDQFGRQWSLAGVPCDPGRGGPPFAMTYAVAATGLDTFEGRTLFWRFLMPSGDVGLLPELSARHQAEVQAGAIAWKKKPSGPAFDAQGSPLRRNHPLRFFIDLDGDGACTPGVDRGGPEVSPASDVVNLTFAYTLAPSEGTITPDGCSPFP